MPCPVRAEQVVVDLRPVSALAMFRIALPRFGKESEFTSSLAGALYGRLGYFTVTARCP